MEASNTKSAAQYRWQHVHPALIVGDRLRAVGQQRQDATCIHFESGVCSAECVAMSVASALTTLGLAKSLALTYASTRASGVPHAFFLAFKDTWFDGCLPEDAVRRIKQMGLQLSITHRFSGDGDLEKFATTNLGRGELVLLTFRSVRSSKTNHAVLGIGAEGVAVGSHRVVDTLLLLDSAAHDPAWRVWNSRLRLNKATDKTHATRSKTLVTWWYESPQWSPELVRLEAAIRMRRNDT
jgi:hypothetical protein